MLKSLELAGFKSFADRTRLDFSSGVTAVVGPNGSGKSNIVDAIKWVLGSQSAKSLRGGEMIDVIFNGSASRRAMNAAEVTLTLDNATRLFDIEAPEVALTRRVLRSGESEYLINRQPCRLRDIRELLAGTGVGTEAYSIIEQGKVDALLQASPHQRRAIFEEAAGISRFRGKRQEALRRLQRVDQNLLRLSDIVDEVETRLRSVRAQAGKAESYRQQTRRLEELRTSLGLVDWSRLTRQLDETTSRLANLEQGQESQRALIAQAETHLPELEKKLETFDARLTEIDRKLAHLRDVRLRSSLLVEQGHGRLREQHGQREQAWSKWRVHLAQVDESHTAIPEVEELARKLDALRFAETRSRQNAVSAQRHRQHSQAQRDEVARRLADARHRLELLHHELTATDRQSGETRQRRDEFESMRREHVETLARLESELAEHKDSVVQHEGRANELNSEVDSWQLQVTALETRLRDVNQSAQEQATQLARLEQRNEIAVELQRRMADRQNQLTEFLRKTTGNASAEAVTVADVLHVDVDLASMIEAALGRSSQQLILSTASRDDAWLANANSQLPVRAVFARLDATPLPNRLERIDLSGESGVIGRADHFVDAEAPYESLVRRLLGQTWLVDTIWTALHLTEDVGRGLRFVTLAGEVVGADGTLELGPRDTELQLLGATDQRQQLAAELESSQREQQQSKQAIEQLEGDLERMRAKLAECAKKQSDVTATLASARQRRLEVEQSLADGRSKLQLATEELEQLSADCESIGQELADRQMQQDQLALQCDQVASTKTELERIAEQAVADEQEAVLEHRRLELELVRQEQELASAERAALQLSSRRTQSPVEDMPAELYAFKLQQQELSQAILAASAEFNQAAWQWERLSRQRRIVAGERATTRQRRQQIAQALHETRRESEQQDKQRQELQVAATRVEYERQTLAERLREDYEIDIATAAARLPVPQLPAERKAVEREIESLRHSINRIGAVNTDALEELDSVEQRFEQISSQYKDLSQAKESLERLIARLNNDSRQLFFDTVDTVRGHFQELYRRLFGGGTADLVLEAATGDDPLECGIEIQACPPGKETRSITLLSGGEKTLTCVALLLAMFRSKPSPFCLLDEVDAALDEANIGRFTRVLSDFLSSTQFIVITHSKKTMTGADTLYGITMQESGISKQVSVRFDDVAEDGTIRAQPNTGQSALRSAA